MIQTAQEQIWDISSVATAIFELMALLMGTIVVAFLIALLTIWLIVGLIKKINPKFSEEIDVWRPTLAIGGALFAGALVFLQVAAFIIIRWL
jgi:hypothetical protein